MFAALIVAAGVMQTIAMQAHAEQTLSVSVARHGQAACRTREYRTRGIPHAGIPPTDVPSQSVPAICARRIAPEAVDPKEQNGWEPVPGTETLCGLKGNNFRGLRHFATGWSCFGRKPDGIFARIRSSRCFMSSLKLLLAAASLVAFTAPVAFAQSAPASDGAKRNSTPGTSPTRKRWPRGTQSVARVTTHA